MAIEALKKRIKTTQDLREVVSTMKSLSSVSILQYEQANTALEKYRKNLKDGFHALALQNGIPNLFVRDNAAPKYMFILIGTDSGMVGKFNKEVIEKAKKVLAANNVSKREAMFITIGKRITMLAEQENLKLFAKYAISNSVKFVNSIAETIIMKIDEATTKNQINHVSVFYHRRRSSGGIVLEHREIIPFDSASFKKLKEKRWETNNIPLIALKKEILLSALINEYLTIDMESKLNYSLAAEHFTRMTNMQNAEKNIDESLEEMNLEYQQQRQENITEELIDVISGAEAME